jgi:hypothetical protein
MISGQNTSPPSMSSAALPSFSPPMPAQMGYGYGGMPMPMPSWPGMPGMPGMGMNMPGMPGVQGIGMPHMGIPGMPQMNHMGQIVQMPWYPSYPALPSGQSLVNQPSGGGMYSYAPGAQSVFGGEFGPPRNNHYAQSQQHPQHAYAQSQHPQQAQSHYAQSSYAQSAYGYEPSPNGRDPDYEMTPPKPGYLRGHGRTTSSSSQTQPNSWRQSSYSSYGGGVGGRGEGREGTDERTDVQWDDAPTPRKRRQSSFGPRHLVN